MKNAMKKLMSLLLVAVLLVSAVPFQADAATGKLIKVVYVDDANNDAEYEAWWDPDDETKGCSVGALYSACFPAALNSAEYTFGNAYRYVASDSTDTKGPVTQNDYIKGGDSVRIRILKAEAPQTPVVPDATEAPAAAEKRDITMQIKYSEGGNVEMTLSITPDGGSAMVSKMLYYHYGKAVYGQKSNKWQETHTFTKAWSSNQQRDVGYEGEIGAGDTVTVILTPKNTNNGGSNNGGSNNGSSTGTNETVANKKITLNINNFEGGPVVWTTSETPDNGYSCVVNDMLYYWYSKTWASSYNCTKVHSSEQKTIDLNTTVNAGDTVTVVLTPKSNNGGNTGSSSNNNQSYNEYLYKPVYLNIYTDGNVSTITKRVNITDGIAADNYVDWNDAYNVVLTYFNAKTSAGVKMNGLYLYENNWASDWTYDNTVSEVKDINTRRAKADVNINVMVYNATLKGTYTADSSNPKTGDEIYMAITVLGLSGAALATAMYVFTKKRVAK